MCAQDVRIRVGHETLLVCVCVCVCVGVGVCVVQEFAEAVMDTFQDRPGAGMLVWCYGAECSSTVKFVASETEDAAPGFTKVEHLLHMRAHIELWTYNSTCSHGEK